MRQIEDVNGGVIHSVREYDIASGTAVVVGQVVKLSAGLVVPAAAGETGAILGVAAESHPGKPDALNERADGTRILVNDAPGAVFACAAPVVAATGGTATTVTASGIAAFAANVFKGGFVKGPDGHMRAISASAVADGTLTLTVDKGEIPVAGDEYVIFPPAGFTAGNLSSDGTKLVLSATAALSLRVMGRIENENKIKLTAVKHSLACG